MLIILFSIFLFKLYSFLSHFSLDLTTSILLNPSSLLLFIFLSVTKNKSSYEVELITFLTPNEFIPVLECYFSNQQATSSQSLHSTSTISFFKWLPKSRYWLFSYRLVLLIERASTSTFNFKI